MYIKSVSEVSKDVFLGVRGWDQWARYEYVNGKWTRTKGVVRPDAATEKRIIERIESYGQRRPRQH